MLNQWETKRRFGTKENIPNYILEKINIRIKKILEKHPDVTEIWLTGSYASGSYIDERSTEEDHMHKGMLKTEVRISDFDFRTVPVVIDRFEDIDINPNRNLYEILVY